MKFDLMIDSDTIFPLLGFTSKQDLYKEKLFYSGSVEYNLKSNENVYFTLSGSSMEPIKMKCDTREVLNKTLKKSRGGISMKQIHLTFTNDLHQTYDFTVPFKMCLKITYV